MDKALEHQPNTFKAWVRTDFTDNRRIEIIIGNYPRSNNTNFEIHVRRQPRVYWNIGQVDWRISEVDLRTGCWEHIAFVLDTLVGKFLFYHNGLLVAEDERTGNDVLLVDAYRFSTDGRG